MLFRLSQYLFLFLRSSIFLTLTIALVGCQLLKPYTGPLVETPGHWKTTYDAPDAGRSVPSSRKEGSIQTPIERSHLEEARKDLANWWEIFDDPMLNQLEEQALDSSYTLWSALERVVEARAQAMVSRSSLMPGIGFDPSFTRTGSLFQNPFSSLSLGTTPNTRQCGTTTTTLTNSSITSSSSGGTTGGLLIPPDFRFVQTQYLLPFNINYQINWWGQLDNAYYAALIRSEAAAQAYLNVLLSLTADIASNYFLLRGLDSQQEVIQGNIRMRQRAFDLNQARFNAGLVTYLDVARAELELARAHSDSDEVRRLRGRQENIIATLVAVPASIFSINYNPIIIPPPVVPTGLPSELLCRRPDIAEAERNLAAAYHDIGVAYANFFPSLNLNAALGLGAPLTHHLFSWKARYWQVGLGIMQTVFDGGRSCANLAYYRARFREAMANYQEVVLKAFQEVEDALINLRQYAAQSQDLATAVHAAQQTLELSQMRYNRGLTSYLDVVDAERCLLETEQNSVIVLGNRYASTVELVRALGGGWGPYRADCGCDSSSDEE